MRLPAGGGPARPASRGRAARPIVAIEVDREQPAGLVGQQRLDADDLPTLQAPQHLLSIERPEGLIRALDRLLKCGAE